MKILVLCIVNFIIFTQSALALEYRQIRNTTDDQFEVIEISNLEQLRLFLKNPQTDQYYKVSTIFNINLKHVNSLLLR